MADIREFPGPYAGHGGPEEEHDPPMPGLLWLSDSFELHKTEYLVRGMLEPGSLIVLYGESGTGKSTLAVDIAFAIATGKRWRGRDVRQGLVLHVAGEGCRGLRMRQAAHVERFETPRTAPYAVLPQAVAFGSSSDTMLVPVIAQAASDIGCAPQLVIVDTLARCMQGDENSSEDMARFIRACDYLRTSTGAAVMVIHHAGKDSSKGARGHSSLRAAADTELEVAGSHNPRILHVRKQRDLEIADSMCFDLEPVTLTVEDDGTNITACVVKHNDGGPPPAKPSGRQQAQLLAELERRFLAGEVCWTDADMRKIGREIGMHKASARSAVLGLFSSNYLVPSVGGATLANPPLNNEG